MAYAIHTDDPHYHLVAGANGYRTLCDLSIKGGKRNVREPRPTARVILQQPSPDSPYRLCPHCAIKQIKMKSSLKSNSEI